MNKLFLLCLFGVVGCGGGSTYVQSDTTLGRVVIYRNGVAYFERYAHVKEDELALTVPADKIDDFLKSLTVADAKTGQPAPISYPTNTSVSSGNVDMKIQLSGPAPHNLKLTYVTESPSWKPSYRITVRPQNRVLLQAWAIVDNTSAEDWNSVKLGVGASSALSFRYDLQSVRVVQRETLHSDDLFAQAPPTGASSYGEAPASGGKRVVGELSDDTIAMSTVEEKPTADFRGHSTPVTQPPAVMPKPSASAPMVDQESRGRGRSSREVAKRKAPARQYQPSQDPGGLGGLALGVQGGVSGGVVGGQVGTKESGGGDQIAAMARNLQNSRNQVIVEGYADPKDGDKFAASLSRANKVREQLIRNGVPAEQVVAVGSGEQKGRAGGVRIVEAPPSPPPAAKQQQGQQPGPSGSPSSDSPAEPIGSSHFESKTAMTLPRGTSAMLSILNAETDGEVVYLYDAESPRGNTSFPFRSIRIKNPTDSALETGPVTVFGEGKFIGEGLCEPIPARSVAFIPYALDRQIVVERKDSDRDEIARILTIQRGVFSTQMQHIKKTVFTLHNRLADPAVVYLRHTVARGFTLTKAPPKQERLGAAYLFRMEVPPTDKLEVVIEESTPVFKSTDIRSDVGMELVKAYIASSALQGPIKAAVEELIKLQQEIGTLEERITTMREQMGEYRARMDELHAQIVTLKLVKTAGPLMRNLEKKLQEVSDKLSSSTLDLVTLQEKLMVARIRFQDAVSELSLEKQPDASDTKPGPTTGI